MTSKVQISVIVAVRDGEACLEACLQSLFNHKPANVEVIVVDDDSSDNTANVAAQWPCRLVSTGRHVGPGRARNIGLAQSCGQLIFFTDADVICSPEVVERAAEFLSQHPDFAAVVGAYTKFTPRTNFVSRYKNLQHHFVHHQCAGPVAAFFTACGMIRREALEAISGFNEDFNGCALEDLELGLRLDSAGYKIFLEPTLQVTHLKHYSLRRLIWIECVQRAIPYAFHLLKQRKLPDELSAQWYQRISCALLYLCIVSVLALVVVPSTTLVAFIGCGLLAHCLLNRNLFTFLWREGGLVFAIGGLSLQTLSYVYSAPMAAIGGLLYVYSSAFPILPKQAREEHQRSIRAVPRTDTRRVQQLANPHIFDVVPFRPPTHSSQIARLGFNENPLGPSPLAVQAIQSFASGVSRYPSDDGIELKLALAKDFGVDYTNVVLGNGASELLELVSRCFLSAGDEVIFCWPTFPMYASLGKLCGARNVVIPLREDRYDLDAIHDHINKRTKLIFITNPNNPSGTVLEQAEFESFIGSIPDHVVVVIDEAYIECLEPHRIQSSKLVRQNVLVVRTFSKIRGLAGLRVGYAVAQSEMVRILEQVRRPFNTNALAQAAALASLQDDAHLKKTLQAYETGRAFFYRLFEQLNLPYVRSVTNFVLVDVRRDSEEVYRQLLGQGFLVKPVPPTQLRVSIGLPEQNHDFGRALDDILRVAVRAQR